MVEQCQNKTRFYFEIEFAHFVWLRAGDIEALFKLYNHKAQGILLEFYAIGSFQTFKKIINQKSVACIDVKQHLI